MHLTYHFLRFLAPALSDSFAGSTVVSCFSQSKDELVLETEGPQETRFIRAHLLPPQVYLSFPNQFHRAKRNTVSLFDPLIGEQILSCRAFSNERALKFELSSGKVLILKLHGNRSNCLLYLPEANEPTALFRNAISEDKNLDWRSLDRELNLSLEHFIFLEGNVSQFLPTLGPVPRAWLKEKAYLNKTLHEKWILIEELVDLLDSPLYALVEKEGELLLSLLPEAQAKATYADPIATCNELFYQALVLGSFEKEKNNLLKSYQDQLKRTQAYLKKSTEKLKELKDSPPPSQLADVLMANLHVFEETLGVVELENFYTGKIVKVSLKPNQKPQELAASLYRKSKNRQLELDQLEKTIAAKKEQEKSLQALLDRLKEAIDFRGLKEFKKEHKEDLPAIKNELGSPFKVFEIEGFTIWVGKSAKDNDELLRNFVHKDDLWLHARQVPGSHVIIRRKGMPTVPQQVLERAASLAAFYSKLKTDSLSPVIVTEAKFVRKVKGSAPGSVVVDKEKVILVAPKGPDKDTALNQ
ncbi:MAG: NFACT RNA binding domain-containing protein [Bacteroidetes bacterium]|nr:NFACT RNA binding domain-containing protein [Bacteroidota bacterium]MDA1268764.1 NFACT RNA binding domain-containing protein [Bacteroidota bacterium]